MSSKNIKVVTAERRRCALCGIKYVNLEDSIFCSEDCKEESKELPSYTCEECGNKYWSPTGKKLKRCRGCSKVAQSLRVMRSRKKCKPNTKIGVGSGGAQWGDSNPAWKGGIKNTSSKYKSCYRVRCMRIHGAECKACGSNDKLEAHHINGDKYDFNMENLVPLCNTCHKYIHSKRKISKSELIARYKEVIRLNAEVKSRKKRENPEVDNPR